MRGDVTDTGGRARHRRRAPFPPRGPLGHAHRWSVSPFHAVVLGGTVRSTARAAAGRHDL
ncbi:hypothetical protein GCM10010266_30050 [Streptomyces griseomycini]|uniref:Uncharacterized protein n=1 Tax=Streptomyces griseomycini TaxID=66895 RepID=A0A7W7M007_9ACTN|nr:hypothetical protein [Streptomyces griseomycini]GGQ04449.1 hypothetical protein GCM10010266_30050 [Streptomyces griseomycini]GGR18081.1 hypothetical protein GCM10015536_24540 [Streptomyces griseomycini]